MKKTITIVLLLLNVMVHAQISSGSLSPHPHAQLDITASNKGILIPRIALRATNDPNPINNIPSEVPNSLLVYNTATTTGPNLVIPGYYHWDTRTSTWNKLLIKTDIEITSTRSSPWNIVGSNTIATSNSSDIYQQGAVGIGYSSLKTTLGAALDVNGDALINGIKVGTGLGSFTSNTVIGYEALSVNTTGKDNTATGNNALRYNTVGQRNTATGFQALYLNTLGSNNIATGYQALLANTTGTQNIATGSQALFSNTLGSNNIATGFQALNKNTTGTQNIATGTSALQNNTGSNNIATGYQALQRNTAGAWNIATGTNALQSNTTGENNIATGFQALQNNSTGTQNIATGTSALQNNTGSNNIATGYQALQRNTAGARNIATGTNALQSNITGENNIATGFQALQNNSTGSHNVATGRNALLNNLGGSNNVAYGLAALQSNTLGNNNIAIGRNALLNSTTGSNNIAIGDHSHLSNQSGASNITIGTRITTVPNTISNRNNAIAIGSEYSGIEEARVYKDNTIQLGNRAIKDVYTYGNIGIRKAPTTPTAPTDNLARVHIQPNTNQDPLILENILTTADAKNPIDNANPAYYDLKISEKGVIRKNIPAPEKLSTAEIYDLSSDTAVPKGDSFGSNGVVLNWRNRAIYNIQDIILPESGVYIFAFRFYGDISGSNSTTNSYYLSAWKNTNTSTSTGLFDIAEIVLIKGNTSRTSYTINMTVSGLKGDKVRFKMSRTDNQLMLRTRPGLYANKTSMIYWRSNL